MLCSECPACSGVKGARSCGPLPVESDPGERADTDADEVPEMEREDIEGVMHMLVGSSRCGERKSPKLLLLPLL
jgi:hypothetical protein